MGCGSSSLKGDANVGVNDPAPQPIKKVRTDFSTVDYEQDTHRRRMTEFAPHETERPASRPKQETYQNESREESYQQAQYSDPGPTERNNDGQDGGGPLEPYHTIDDEHMEGEDPQHQYQQMNNMNQTHYDDSNNNTTAVNEYPHETMNHTQNNMMQTDPTSEASKNVFAYDNDPANPQQQLHHNTQHQNNNNLTAIGGDSDNISNSNSNSNSGSGAGGKERQRSWLGQKYAQYQDHKTGRNNQLSDEELKQYTGKDRAELNDWAKDRPVGGNRPAGEVAMAGEAGYGAGWTS